MRGERRPCVHEGEFVGFGARFDRRVQFVCGFVQFLLVGGGEEVGVARLAFRREQPRIAEHDDFRGRRSCTDVVVGRVEHAGQFVCDVAVRFTDRAPTREVVERAVEDHVAEARIVAADGDRHERRRAAQRAELVAVDVGRLRPTAGLKAQRVSLRGRDLGPICLGAALAAARFGVEHARSHARGVRVPERHVLRCRCGGGRCCERPCDERHDADGTSQFPHRSPSHSFKCAGGADCLTPPPSAGPA